MNPSAPIHQKKSHPNGGVLAARPGGGGGLRAPHYYHMHTARGCVGEGGGGWGVSHTRTGPAPRPGSWTSFFHSLLAGSLGRRLFLWFRPCSEQAFHTSQLEGPLGNELRGVLG